MLSYAYFAGRANVIAVPQRDRNHFESIHTHVSCFLFVISNFQVLPDTRTRRGVRIAEESSLSTGPSVEEVHPGVLIQGPPPPKAELPIRLYFDSAFITATKCFAEP